ncbi:MAG: class I SAM-dependent methyltransferase [Salinibacter sp.]
MLSRREARAVYDRIGAWQDTQSFYEAPALSALAAHGEFQDARRIFEVGCGTGRFAERLLHDRCPPDAQYEGVDLSTAMVTRARERLASFGGRATVRQTDGRLTFERPSGSQDRVLATYVLDLLSPGDARTLIDEAHRLLAADGRLCLAGLTWGRGVLSRIVSHGWDALHAYRPAWVGGCRPVRARSLLHEARWDEEHHRVVRAWGVPSEVLVAAPR